VFSYLIEDRSCPPGLPSSLLLQKLLAVVQLLVDLAKRQFKVASLLLQRGTMFFQNAHVMLQLRPRIVGGRIVHIDEVENFGKLKTHPFAAQSQFKTCAVACVVDAVASFPLWADDALVFIEAYRARRDPEFLGEIGDRPGQ